jgi:hypothetical protein
MLDYPYICSREPKVGISNDKIQQNASHPDRLSVGNQQVANPCELVTALLLLKYRQDGEWPETAKMILGA